MELTLWTLSTLHGLCSYEIAEGPYDMDVLGGRVNLFNPTAGKTAFAVALNGAYGNPAIQFDLPLNVTPNVLVSLTLANAQPIDEKYFKNQRSQATTSTTTLIPSAQELILTDNLSDAVCDSLGEPGNPINPVFALFDGFYWIHDPRFVSRDPRRLQVALM